MSLLASPTLDSAVDAQFAPHFTVPGMTLDDVFGTVDWSRHDVVIQAKKTSSFRNLRLRRRPRGPTPR
jgi:hypothetical protein